MFDDQRIEPAVFLLVTDETACHGDFMICKLHRDVFPAQQAPGIERCLKTGYLVGGFSPSPLKNDGLKVSWDDEIPNL